MRNFIIFRWTATRLALAATLTAALIGVACVTDDDGDDTLTAAALALAAAQNVSSGGSSSTACSGSGHCILFVPAANAIVNTGVSGLDSQCNSAADKPSGGGTYKAMVADGTNRIACTTANCGTGTGEHTDWVLKPSKEYRRSDGSTVLGTTTANGVFSFPLTNAIKTAVVGTNSTRTGLETNWTSSANDCSNWGDNTAGSSSAGGLHDQTNSNLLNIGTSGCSNASKVICVEQ
ncbi:MAG: DUF1554 domain-containing protein [Leptospirales bacterium]|jgi:hypothetical protein